MLRARVKESARWFSVTACGGIEFSKTAWLPVPAGMEGEALNSPYLEVESEGEETPPPAPPAKETEATAEVTPTEPAPKPAPKKRGK